MSLIRKGDKLPVGIDSFRRLVETNCTFVDKTLLINEFISASDIVSLILRPRRFGKSMNLEMLRYFFELVPAATPDTCCRRDLFKGLLIETLHPAHFESHFGKYPCIYLSLKDFKATSWPLMLQQIQNRISDLFDTHNYILDTLKGNNARKFQSIVNREDDYIQSSLKFLSQLLTKYHGSPCIVLIDEYDAPLECAFQNNSDVPTHKGYEFLKEAKTFFGTLFSGLLKSNDRNIYKALLVGVLRVAKSGFLSDLNNLSVFPLFKNDYADKFGFTEAETKAFIDRHKVDFDSNTIRKWYDSYLGGKDVALYNPWSIVSLCRFNDLKPYWVETGSTSSIKELLWQADIDFQQKADQLIEGKSISIKIHHDISYETLRRSPKKALWSLLYYSGYITVAIEDRNAGMEFAQGILTSFVILDDAIDYEYSARIPNLEVLNEWKGWFTTFIFTDDDVGTLLDFLLAGNGSEFSSVFPRSLQASLSYFDVGGSQSGKKAESFYHAFCLGLFIHARSRGCEVKSNYTAGEGRLDLAIYPRRNLNMHAVIMEFKILYGNESKADAATAGLCQIHEKNYRALLPADLTKLVELGIAFEGNSSCVAFRKMSKVNEAWVEIN